MGYRWWVGQPWSLPLFDSMSEATVKRAKAEVSLPDGSQRAGLLQREDRDPRHAAHVPALPTEERVPAQVGAADQEEQNSTGSRRTRPRPVRETARLHDPGGRRRALPDVPDPVRGAVPSVARLPPGRRARDDVTLRHLWHKILALCFSDC